MPSEIARQLRNRDPENEEEEVSLEEHTSLLGKLLSSMTNILERLTKGSTKSSIETPLWR